MDSQSGIDAQDSVCKRSEGCCLYGLWLPEQSGLGLQFDLSPEVKGQALQQARQQATQDAKTTAGAFALVIILPDHAF